MTTTTTTYRCCLCGQNGHYSFKGIREINPDNFPVNLQENVSKIIVNKVRINRENLNQIFGFIPQGFVQCPNFCSFCQTGGHCCLDEQAANHQFNISNDKPVFGDFLKFIDDGDFQTLPQFASSMVQDIGIRRILTVINCGNLKQLFRDAVPAPAPVAVPAPVAAKVTVSSKKIGKRAMRTAKRLSKEEWDNIVYPENDVDDNGLLSSQASRCY